MHDSNSLSAIQNTTFQNEITIFQNEFNKLKRKADKLHELNSKTSPEALKRLIEINQQIHLLNQSLPKTSKRSRTENLTPRSNQDSLTYRLAVQVLVETPEEEAPSQENIQARSSPSASNSPPKDNRFSLQFLVDAPEQEAPSQENIQARSSPPASNSPPKDNRFSLQFLVDAPEQEAPSQENIQARSSPPTSNPPPKDNRFSLQFLVDAPEEEALAQENISTYLQAPLSHVTPDHESTANHRALQFLWQTPEDSSYPEIDHPLQYEVSPDHHASSSKDQEREMEFRRDLAPISFSQRQDDIIPNRIGSGFDLSSLKLTRSFKIDKKVEKIFLTQTQTCLILAQGSRRQFYLETWNLNGSRKNSLMSDLKIKGMAVNDLYTAIIFQEESIIKIWKTTSQNDLFLNFDSPTYVFNHINLPILIDNTDYISLSDHVLGIGLHSGKVLIIDLKAIVCKPVVLMDRSCLSTIYVNSNYVFSACQNHFVKYYNLVNDQSPKRIGNLTTVICAISMWGPHVYLGDKKGVIQIWDLKEGLRIFETSISDGPVVGFLPDDKGFFAATTEALIYFEGTEFKQKFIHNNFKNPITTLAKLDNSIVVGTATGEIFEFTMA
ncbi:MAG: hypothetical protein CK425_12700 [Parachlamydia sp.]|nr:MAG: hypothetical protein CK425_12700 [Parachlamydia sp.]